MFLPLTQITPLMRNHYEHLLKLRADIVLLSNEVIDTLQSKGISLPNGLREREDILPIWYICEECSSRVSLHFIPADISRAKGACQFCGSDYEFDLGPNSTPDIGQLCHRMAPRVLFDDLLDIISLGISGGAGYLGGAEHVLVSGLVANKLGWNVPPECLWRPRGIYYGPAECRAAYLLAQSDSGTLPEKANQALYRVFSGRASILYHILSQGIEGTLETWRRHFANGGHVYDVNIGQGLFEIPGDMALRLAQRLYRIELSPS